MSENEWMSRSGPKLQLLHVSTFCSCVVAVVSARLSCWSADKETSLCQSERFQQDCSESHCVNVNCTVVRVSRTDGSQSTWLLKRTISVKDKEKNVQLEFEKEVSLDLGLGASGVDTGLRLPGDGSDQEGQELRWNYVRLKSATPPQEGISTGHNNRAGAWQIQWKPRDHSEKTVFS